MELVSQAHAVAPLPQVPAGRRALAGRRLRVSGSSSVTRERSVTTVLELFATACSVAAVAAGVPALPVLPPRRSGPASTG